MLIIIRKELLVNIYNLTTKQTNQLRRLLSYPRQRARDIFYRFLFFRVNGSIKSRRECEHGSIWRSFVIFAKRPILLESRAIFRVISRTVFPGETKLTSHYRVPAGATRACTSRCPKTVLRRGEKDALPFSRKTETPLSTLYDRFCGKCPATHQTRSFLSKLDPASCPNILADKINPEAIPRKRAFSK